MGAEAYATGSQGVALATVPSLHTAAHEAAHVVQQRATIAAIADVALLDRAAASSQFSAGSADSTACRG